MHSGTQAVEYSNCSTTKVVKFEELTFEKADYARDKQKKVSTGSGKARKLLFYPTICKEGTRFLCIYCFVEKSDYNVGIAKGVLLYLPGIYCIFFYDGVSLV